MVATTYRTVSLRAVQMFSGEGWVHEEENRQIAEQKRGEQHITMWQRELEENVKSAQFSYRLRGIGETLSNRWIIHQFTRNRDC